jgi:dedicator of cytokinesis protein 3
MTSQWQPLPFFHTGFVIHPYHPLSTPPTSPLQPETSKAAAYRNRFSWSGIPSSNGGKKGKLNVYEVPLDIGDEVFAFEEYKCVSEHDGKEVEVWYRG